MTDVAAGAVDVVVVLGVTRVMGVVVGAVTATDTLDSLCDGAEVDEETVASGESSVVVDEAEGFGAETFDRMDDSDVESFAEPTSNVKIRMDPMRVVITATPKGEETARRAVRMPGTAM